MLVGHASVLGGPLASSKIELRRAKNGKRGHSVLAKTRSDRGGRFYLQVPSDVRSTDVLYVTTEGGTRLTSSGASRAVPKQLKLATLLGLSRPGKIAVTERTTAASGFAAAQFLRKDRLRGKAPGLPNAASMSQNLVNIRTGRLAELLHRRPNGNRTSAKATLNSLSNAVSACAKKSVQCRKLLRSATAGVGVKPRSTWQAMALTARFPAYRSRKLFRVQKRAKTFAPALTKRPTAWTLALKFVGNRRQFDGPGNVAVDSDGNVWANNNYQKSKDPTKICGSKNLFKLLPYERGAPVRTYSGGGLDGAGFGIGIDPKGHIWVGNFGFMGIECTTPPTRNSVSEFRPNGKAVSGPLGYTTDLSMPQATLSDRDGNIWIASCKSGVLTRYPKGNPHRARVISRSVPKAFGIAIDRNGAAWVTSNSGNEVFAFDRHGNELPGSPFTDPAMKLPLGIASDSQGNSWVSNSQVLVAPCQTHEPMATPPSGVHGTLTKLDANGNPQSYRGGGLTVPWGIVVDGADNVWVANFAGQRLSHFCGAKPRTCGKKKKTGQALSPDTTGYAFDGLQRSTGLGLDSSGNVWVTNNWKQIPARINPGGDGLVAFIGLASPVKTPVIGPPQRP